MPRFNRDHRPTVWLLSTLLCCACAAPGGRSSEPGPEAICLMAQDNGSQTDRDFVSAFQAEALGKFSPRILDDAQEAARDCEILIALSYSESIYESGDSKAVADISFLKTNQRVRTETKSKGDSARSNIVKALMNSVLKTLGIAAIDEDLDLTVCVLSDAPGLAHEFVRTTKRNKPNFSRVIEASEDPDCDISIAIGRPVPGKTATSRKISAKARASRADKEFWSEELETTGSPDAMLPTLSADFCRGVADDLEKLQKDFGVVLRHPKTE